MVYDNRDLGALMLCGLCRYLPTDINQTFNSPYLSTMQLYTLKCRRLISMQSNKMSYALTRDGRDILEEFGYSFPKDVCANLKKPSYFRKLRSSRFIAGMFLAGIDVFCPDAITLAGKETGFVSSLIIRSSKDDKALAGARLLGILKIGCSAYVPYHIENANEWIIPRFEREIFTSQIMGMKSVKNINLILTGKCLEELWVNVHPSKSSVPEPNGLKRFDIALEEIGCDYLLVPENNFGVTQLSVIKIAGYKKRLARALGCNTEDKQGFIACDGILSDTPYIIAIDFNVKRIIRALKQIEITDPDKVPKVCCLPFQEKTMFRLLKKYKAQKTVVVTVDEDSIHEVFPETLARENIFDLPLGKKGLPVDANERKIR